MELSNGESPFQQISNRKLSITFSLETFQCSLRHLANGQRSVLDGYAGKHCSLSNSLKTIKEFDHRGSMSAAH